MDVAELARYLRRDAREVSKLASRGQIPGRKVGGDWRFTLAEINHWLETQLPGYSEEELRAFDPGPSEAEPLLTSLMPEACVAVPLAAGTKGSVLRELVKLAEQSWLVYDPDAILDAIQKREEMASTALEVGVAIPHPRRPMPLALGDSVVAFGRTASGVPFGDPRGGLTDLFFLVCCTDDQTHLRALARIARLILRPGFLDQLRAAETPGEARRVIEEAEGELRG